MRNRFSKYFESRRTNLTGTKDQIQASNDEHTDQNFTRLLHSPAIERIVNSKAEQEEKIDEQESDGSGGAFSSTEELIDDEE